MPTYRYECAGCGRVHETFHSINGRRPRKCPDCGGKLERLIGGGGGVILKGEGFYTTEYRSESYKQAAKKEQESAKPKSESKKSGSGKAKKSDGKAGAKKPKSSE